MISYWLTCTACLNGEQTADIFYFKYMLIGLSWGIVGQRDLIFAGVGIFSGCIFIDSDAGFWHL